MAELKTKKNKKSVTNFLDQVENEKRRKDSYVVLDMMKEVTGEEPSMWGDSIIGFGDYHYKYKTGREGDWFKIGFSPRKQNLTLYFMVGFITEEEKMEKLGKYKTGVGCLYINKLEDVDLDVLKELMIDSINKKYDY